MWYLKSTLQCTLEPLGQIYSMFEATPFYGIVFSSTQFSVKTSLFAFVFATQDEDFEVLTVVICCERIGMDWGITSLATAMEM